MCAGQHWFQTESCFALVVNNAPSRRLDSRWHWVGDCGEVGVSSLCGSRLPDARQHVQMNSEGLWGQVNAARVVLSTGVDHDDMAPDRRVDALWDVERCRRIGATSSDARPQSVGGPGKSVAAPTSNHRLQWRDR